MTCCPTCNRPWPGAVDPTPTVDQLRAACRERGLWLSPDDRVREADAAALIGLQPKTLANWRFAAAPLPFVTRSGRPLYALADLAVHLADAEK